MKPTQTETRVKDLRRQLALAEHMAHTTKDSAEYVHYHRLAREAALQLREIEEMAE